ncbi:MULTISPECIES: hypothetical protein [Corynebacterium]|uniref:hypothetical protein n=1 Tax=Corynebacterium TaxID=1716 RepID=UPI0003B8EA5C|nr:MULTISPECIES: hypothetical protein [Corynebacterium]ERS41855.1 hypothetical protein HMPREF1293_02006 [Corynebacterium sp. KPL1996]ERS44684.1 hypothetical protein HMPREF1287_01177 [Corynebacterium sp. KPL1986]ERS72609.1 hypothetical protein HMPREF1295_01536 [Corynebacterium sp. KPL1998]ERS73932.1 hypothetical protein HMPREF1300_00915 [Corynebacterium sp. KPL2004]MCT1410018.1 hypothetical protein [Corynebacterium accolens]
MPVFGYESITPSREAKKVALARLEGEVLDWARDHGDAFPTLRDLCHQIEVEIEKEREQL